MKKISAVDIEGALGVTPSKFIKKDMPGIANNT
jgi:hypothetical protein